MKLVLAVGLDQLSKFKVFFRHFDVLNNLLMELLKVVNHAPWQVEKLTRQQYANMSHDSRKLTFTTVCTANIISLDSWKLTLTAVCTANISLDSWRAVSVVVTTVSSVRVRIF